MPRSSGYIMNQRLIMLADEEVEDQKVLGLSMVIYR